MALKSDSDGRTPKRRKKHHAGAFLDLPPEASDYASARAVVLPLPYEATVSYGEGTARGPEAIIAASQQVELYDIAVDAEPALDYGVHTLPAPRCLAGKTNGTSPAAVMDGIAEEVARHARAGKFVIGLGGEHSVSFGCARGLADAFGSFTLVHVDAHADLRDAYEDDPFSHACVARRIAEMPQCEAVLQLGIRSTSPDQMAFARAHRPKANIRPLVKTWFAHDMHADKGWKKEFKRHVKGRKVFFTFDVDGLDPAIVPTTGTPEPNGLTWRQLLAIAEIMTENAYKVLGMDCVELAPRDGLHHADFTIAKALYAMTTMVMRKR